MQIHNIELRNMICRLGAIATKVEGAFVRLAEGP